MKRIRIATFGSPHDYRQSLLPIIAQSLGYQLDWVHPKDMGKHQVEMFLRHLAVKEDVTANTQNVAFCALCFLYRHVLKQPLEDVSALRAKKLNRTCQCL